MKTISDHIQILKVATKPFQGQEPGTSGLRKKVTQFEKPQYTQNFLQAYFNALRKDNLSPKNTLLVGGDGRYLSDKVIEAVLKIACANGVDEVHVAKNGLMSTPACSAYIRNLNKQFGNCLGGILLTASHNPGGPKEDFGIKFNSRNGGPAQEEFTSLVHKQTLKIHEYRIVNFDFLSQININQPGNYLFEHVNRTDKPVFKICVVENVDHYVSLLKQQFDFSVIEKLFSREDFHFIFDGMYGAAGPYAKAIFNEVFKGNIHLINCENQPDFHGLHPDPNLKCAQQLVKVMGVGSQQPSKFDFGAACDGDADRNMITGKNFFVTPSDSLAILCANSSLFLKTELKGIARSMPTSGAVDRVANKLGVKVYETPTGWKYFGNLMEDGLISICGQESFGTGSNHVRQKDGIWTILAWLQVLAKVNQNIQFGKFKGIRQICHDFWQTYGRNYYSRYDYQNCKTEKANEIWKKLQEEAKTKEINFQGEKIQGKIFAYTDPVNQSISQNQGIIFSYPDGSRVIFRKSKTGAVGITLRIYFQKFDKENFNLPASVALKEMIKFGLKISQVHELSGKENPDVIT